MRAGLGPRRRARGRWWDEGEGRGGLHISTIALTYNLKRTTGLPEAAVGLLSGDGFIFPPDTDSEFDTPSTIETIVAALQAAGHTVHPVEATADLPQWFLTHHVDLVFNIAEGLHGDHRESQVPAILESLGVPCTGSDSVALALALDKAKSKQILAVEGIPTPAWQLFATASAPLSPALSFPLIVKPNREGSAKGIWRESVVRDEPTLRQQIQRVLDRYRQEVLVEEFIEGRELTVGILGETVLPVLEIDFGPCRPSGEFFYSWRMKEFQGNVSLGLAPALHCPARLEGPVSARVQAIALRAHQALGCTDLSRTDIRLAPDGTPYVLEVNPLPGLSPLDSNLPFMASAAGLTHSALIHRIVELAAARHARSGRSAPRRTAGGSVRAEGDGLMTHASGRPPADPGAAAGRAGGMGEQEGAR